MPAPALGGAIALRNSPPVITGIAGCTLMVPKVLD
jgi:hypothetical protein